MGIYIYIYLVFSSSWKCEKKIIIMKKRKKKKIGAGTGWATAQIVL